MEEERWAVWETAGLFAVLAAGNLLHFVYEWSGGSPVAAMFAAGNESTWEHMKLLTMPWILWSLLETMALGRDALAPRAAGLLAGLAVIPMLFYTYRGVLGLNVDFVNIAIFQVAVLLACWVSRRVREKGLCGAKGWPTAGLFLLLAVGALFIRWTFQPPALPLFADPRTGLTGIPK